MRNVILFFIIALCVSSCKREKSDHVVFPYTTLSGETLFAVGDGDYYYDLAMTDSFYVFLDLRSDSLVHVYSRFDATLQYKICATGNQHRYTQAVLAKTNHENKLLLINQEAEELVLDQDPQKARLKSEAREMPSIRSINYNLTTAEVIASPIVRNKGRMFYSYADGRYSWFTPNQPVDSLKKYNNAFVANMLVNEKKNTAVAALRFLNLIEFYDLNGRCIKSTILGDRLIYPETNEMGQTVDTVNTLKHIVDIAGTDNYVYCLYDGTAAYSQQTQLMVFDWQGKHQATFDLHKGIRKLAVDPAGKWLIGIAHDGDEKQEIILYTFEP